MDTQYDNSFWQNELKNVKVNSDLNADFKEINLEALLGKPLKRGSHTWFKYKFCM